MKTKLLLLLILAMLTTAADYDKEIEWFIVFQPWKAIALEEQIAELEAELAVANGIAASVAQVDSLESQISSLKSQRDNIAASIAPLAQQVAIAQGELASARAATVSINTMVGAFTPDMGIVGCRTFDGRSMTPTFHDQSLVCITQNASYIQNNIGIGKIVIAPCSYYGAGVSVIHRVHSKVNGKWVLKGDYNQILDPCHQSTSDIQWMVTGFVRNPY